MIIETVVVRRSKDLFSECESKVIALLIEDSPQHRVSAEEDSHLALPLLLHLGKYLVPVWPASISPGFETGN